MPEDENELLDNEETPVGDDDDNNDNDNDNNDDDEEDDDMSDTPLNKLKRSALLHYLSAAFDVSTQTPGWFLIGKDVEDMSVELNPDTETKKNILDETSVIDKGYEPSFEVDTYYATPADGDFYTKLKDIAMNRKTDDSCKTLCLEILVDKSTGPFDAWQEEVIVKPKSYGGPQGGISIPYTVSFTGNRVVGTATISDRVPSFTATT